MREERKQHVEMEIIPKTGKLEQELDAIELSLSRIQTRLEKALEDAQTLRAVLQQCDALDDKEDQDGRE